MDVAPEPTHAILCIDQSGSMRTTDVKPAVKGGAKQGRWSAVFECAIDFVRDQAKAGDGTATTASVVFSLVLFSDTGRVVFERFSASQAKAALEKACREEKPSGGTCFAAAFKEVDSVSRGSTGGVLCVFLSDGRPGDLQFPPPKANEPIQLTYRSHGKKFDSAAHHLQELCDQHGDRLTMHYVAIHPDGHPWLKKLARASNGTFHDARLSLDPDDDEVQIVAPPAAAAGGARLPIVVDDDDDDVQFVAFKTAEQAARERAAAAMAAGQVISVGSSMRSTFRAISQTLTSMRSTSANGGSVVERAVVLEGASGPSLQREYQATRMVLDASQNKFEVPPGEKPNERRVRLSTQPFAQGGLRNVYAMVELPRNAAFESPKHLVAKESRHVVGYKERLAFHTETSACQARAAQLARAFNSKCARRRLGEPIEFLRADVYRLRDEEASGGYRYLAVEARLEDGTYEKFNSNNGFVLRNGSSGRRSSAPFSSGGTAGEAARLDVPQAFSHFSYEHTGGDEMVVDIQGSALRYTDPQLHSSDCRYGRADRGDKGFFDFFSTHKCNARCRALGLPERDAHSLIDLDL